MGKESIDNYSMHGEREGSVETDLSDLGEERHNSEYSVFQGRRM